MTDPIQTSRLDRATTAKLRTPAELGAFMDSRGMAYSQNFRDATLPTQALRENFDLAYKLTPALPDRKLKNRGSSTALIMEHPQTPDDHHGAIKATIAETVGQSLQAGVGVMWVHAPISPRYHLANADGRTTSPLPEKMRENIKALLTNQGVAVMGNAIGWEDSSLSFRNGGFDPSGTLHQITAFVVNSTGNDGMYGVRGNAYPQQKHDGMSHFPPLAIHVGAAAMNNPYLRGSGWHIEGYSSANCPTLLAPVAVAQKMVWSKQRGPQKITGSSAAEPYMVGCLAALNKRFGPHLTREQILYAVLATATPIDLVWADYDSNKNPHQRPINYRPNAHGLPFNAEYGGFGMINVRKADELLAHMVSLTQEHPDRITTPVEEKLIYDSDTAPEVKRDTNGKFVYALDMQTEGRALKTTIAAEFANGHHGKITITSPSGTTFPMVMSKLPKHSILKHRDPTMMRVWKPSPSDVFGLSTSHAWAGEPLSGTWTITSTRPIKRLEMFQHHFMERDIVADLDNKTVNRLLAEPSPDISGAKDIPEMDRNYHPPAPLPLNRIAKITHRGNGLAGETVAQQTYTRPF